MINFLRSLYILEISPLSDVGLVKIFSHSVGCRFVLLTVSFALQKLFSFRRSHLLIVSLSVCYWVIFGKWSYTGKNNCSLGRQAIPNSRRRSREEGRWLSKKSSRSANTRMCCSLPRAVSKAECVSIQLVP